MSDKSQSIKSKLIKLQNLLNSQSASLSLSQCLKQIIAYFNTIDLDNEQVARNEVYDELKDTVKAIFAYLDRLKDTTTQIAKKIELSIKDLLIQISRFCSAFFYKYHPQGCAEMIKEFLSSQCKLFLPTFSEANAIQVKEEKQVQKEKFIWAKISHFKSPFFAQCIEVILFNINNFSKKFEESRVIIIEQYMRLLYYMDDYIIKTKIEDLCVRDIDCLEKLFRNPSKEIMKDVTKQNLQQLINYLFKLVRGIRNNNLKERIGMLGAVLGLSMLKMPSIQKKIAGSKIINKFSYDLMYKSSYNFSDQFYCQWLINEGFFEIIVEENCQASIIKFCDDSLKILMKKGCISKQRLQKFFEILQKVDSQLRKLMLRAVDTYRLDYSQIQILLQIFKVLKNSDFYDDEFFYFYEGISRYATSNQLSIMIQTIEKILATYYSTFSNHLIKRRGSECYAYIFEKITVFKDMEDRLVAYKSVAQQFLAEPTESRLIMLKSLYKNISQSRLNYYYQQKLALDVVQQLQFIQKSIQHANNLILKQDLIYFIKFLLQKYKSNYNCKGFTKQDLIKSVDSAQIFEEMLKISKQSQVFGLLDDLCTQIKVKEFSFTCIRWAFIQLNKIHVKPIKKQYTDLICSYASIESIEKFKGVDLLIYLIFNSERDLVRKGACELLSEFATNFTSQFRSEGQQYLIHYMKNMLAIIKIKIKEYLEKEEKISSIYGSLQLIQSFMLNTQYFGVGSLRAHNSHIPRSSVWLKIYNNCGIGDDTLKIFEKRFASNLTLFEVIKQVAEQFKIGPLDLGLQYPNFEIIKYHGLTLQQLTISGLELNAVKLPQSRTKTQPMILNGQLTERAKTIFTQIFNKYSIEGIMGQKQCSNYIAGVTTTYCPINDSRISQLFYRYDTDRDDKITIEDFFRFYKDCIEDPIKLENVQKNLYNLHFRRDLMPYNAELECNQQLLFRYHLFHDKEIYQFLFELSKHEDLNLSRLAQNILVRLPTYDKVTSSLANTFDLKGKNSFQIQYLLTALQTYLNNNKDASTDLIRKGNHISIFQYLCSLADDQNRSKNDQNCLIICLYILRTLLGDFNLKSFIPKRPELTFQLPETDIFLKIISESIKNSDGTLLQPTFALQLTQNQLPTTLLQQVAFSKDKDTRVIACNFLYIWLQSGKGKDLNLFKIPISPQNNEQWFNLLTIATHMDLNVDKKEIFNNCVETVMNNSESLHGHRYNPLINGCLKIIKQLYYRLDNNQKDLLDKCLTQILPNLLSNQNREIVYRLKENNPEVLIQDLIFVADINISKQVQARNRFVGLRNLGCICYMNSILQQFFMIKSFYKLIMSLEAKKEYSKVNDIVLVDDFLAQLQEMYVNLEWSQKQYYDPTKFCLAIKDSQGKPINTLIQQDAHEFLNTAFEKIEGYAKKQEKLKILEKLFGGKTVTEIICQTCKTKNEVLQDFYHLTVEVKGMKSLKESFDKFVQIQEIADYFCSSCNKKVEKITKQMLIKESPSVLVINLQRIIFDLQIFLKVKVHTKLTFDQKLDLHNYFSSGSKPALYLLKGVVIHTGTSEGGHYYSLIKQEGKWYKFNDQTVTSFNQSDIGRQAFGGDDATDYWGQQSSSTNAYILFYQKIQEGQQDQIEVKPRINTDLIEKVKLQNKQFTRQIQLMQPSFFTTLNNLFLKAAKPYKQQNRDQAKQIYLLYLKVVKHLVVNTQLKIQIITQIKNNILDLIQILPELSYSSLLQFSGDQVQEAICGNNQVSIRDLFGKLYGKLFRNIMQSKDQEARQTIKFIIEKILSWFFQENFLKNLHKSYQYFELIKELIIFNRQIRELILNKDFLALYCDILMGHESILFGKEKKKVQFHYSQAIPITTIINYLFRSKFATKQEYDKQKLTQNEKKIFYSPSFYKKIMKSKLDIGILAPIIQRISYRNEQYSKMIAEILIIGMNSNDEIEDKNIVFINIKAFLLVEDELTSERIKWVLGIPQLLNIGYSIPQFGLEISSESIVYSYVSTLLFIKDEKYKPFLFALFEKRKFFCSFSSYGILILLELVNQSQSVRNYILRLPAPVYIFKSYFSWIDIFIHRVKNQEHYSLPIDKNILADKLTKLMDEIKIKIAFNPLYLSLPVNRQIIGKNAELFSILKTNQKQYSLGIYSHQTFNLQNKPTDKGNESLPDHEFSFISSGEQNTAKFFIKGIQYGFEENPDIKKKITVYSYSIKNELPLQITFKIPGFNHIIYLRPGDHQINTPYCEGEISNLMQIKVIHPPQQQKKLEQPPKQQQKSAKQSQDPFFTTDFESSGSVANNYFLEIQCKQCTLVNFGREKCQLCESDLLS